MATTADIETTTKKILVLQVLNLEQEMGEWGFKALKQMVKITFNTVSFLKMAVVIPILTMLFRINSKRCWSTIRSY